MKKYLIIIVFFSDGLLIYPQSADINTTRHYKGDVILSLSPDVMFNTPNGMQFAGGIKIQLFLGRRFSLDADLVIGRDYYHASPGLIGIPLGILGLNSDDEESTLRDFLISVAALALSFEHMSYHIPLRDNLEIAPYISLLRYKYAYKHGNYSDPDFIGEQFACAAGAQLNTYFGKFLLGPYIEYSMGYIDFNPGLNAGLNLGFSFPTRLLQE